MFKRVVLIVLDGVGVGALPDADTYDDQCAATLPHVAEYVGGLKLPTLEHMGLGNITPIAGVSPVDSGISYYGKLAEVSPGKDSVTGHWELAGVPVQEPFATYTDGFPADIIDKFSALAGSYPLGNIAASGTDIIRQFGEEHLRTGRLIVYTSVDSVFQIAAHEEVLAPDDLYKLCQQTEQMLAPYRICRVIARPFAGLAAETFYRTAGRHDFSCKPPGHTMLDELSMAGIGTYGIGKIFDLFAGQGVQRSWATSSSQEGMHLTVDVVKRFDTGLIFVNLVDFDMLYGHRGDVEGFAQGLMAFDRWLPNLLKNLSADDLLLVTADHGCDPTVRGSDHTREYVPLLVYSPKFRAGSDLGIRSSFADVGATISDNFGVNYSFGESFLSLLS